MKEFPQLQLIYSINILIYNIYIYMIFLRGNSILDSLISISGLNDFKVKILTNCYAGQLQLSLKANSQSGPRQFLATGSPSKMMKNNFYFTLKSLFVLKTLKYLCQVFGHIQTRTDLKAKISFKIYDVINWETNNYNIEITQ